MIAGLLMGVAACGSSGGSDAKTSDTKAKTEEGSTTDSGNADVKAYCEAVDDYVAKVKDAEGDAAKAAALSDEAQKLTDKATALATANLDSGDAQDVADCTKKSTDALMPS